MSFILEALKKSEEKRRQGETPTLPGAGPPAPPPGRRPRWPYLLIAVLVLNAILVGWWLIGNRQETVPPSVAQGSPQGPVETAPLPRESASFVPTDVVPRQTPALAREETVQGGVGPVPDLPSEEEPSRPVAMEGSQPLDEEITTGEKAGVESLPSEEEPTPRDAAVSSATAPAAEPEGQEPEEERIYRLEELPAQLRGRVPQMELTLHFYAPEAPARLVRINGANLREGYRLGEEVRVEEITPEGIIFSIQGLLFEVPGLVSGR